MHFTKYSWIPYPLNSMRIAIALNPLGFWLIPRGRINWNMPESLREQGYTIWWFRWAFFQIEYSRWL